MLRRVDDLVSCCPVLSAGTKPSRVKRISVKQRRYKHDYFNRWADSQASPYYWLQIDYDTEDCRPFHITAEINNLRDGHIIWPVKDIDITSILPLDHLDFRSGAHDLSDWHRKLSTSFGKGGIPFPIPPTKAFSSYEEYIRSSDFTRNNCVDIDCIKKNGDRFIGIEATHLRKKMRTKDEAHRLVGQILEKRFFLSNAHQLIVQHNFMQLLGGKLFLLIYNTHEEQQLDMKGKSILLPVYNVTLDYIRRKDLKACIDATIYSPFFQNYNRCFETS